MQGRGEEVNIFSYVNLAQWPYANQDLGKNKIRDIIHQVYQPCHLEITLYYHTKLLCEELIIDLITFVNIEENILANLPFKVVERSY